MGKDMITSNKSRLKHIVTGQECEANRRIHPCAEKCQGLESLCPDGATRSKLEFDTTGEPGLEMRSLGQIIEDDG